MNEIHSASYTHDLVTTARRIGCADTGEAEHRRFRGAVWVWLLITAVGAWVVWRVVATTWRSSSGSSGFIGFSIG